MKNKLIYGFLVLCTGLIWSCTKMDHTYNQFIKNGETKYAGVVRSIETHPGRNKIEIQFLKSMDPNVVKYVIYWNDKADSVAITPTTSSDTVKQIINGLKEQTYNFEMVSFDKYGHSSVETLFNGKVYGETYESRLLSRAVTTSNTKNGLLLAFSSAEPTNASTDVTYTNTSGVLKTVTIPSTISTYTITDNWKGQIIVKSSFVPDKSIDTFYSTAATISFNPISATYICTGNMVDYPNAGFKGLYPWNVVLTANSLTQVVMVDNDFAKDITHYYLNGTTRSSYASFGLIFNLDADLKIISIENKYGQPAPNGCSAELDPSGVNKFDPTTRTLKVKYWMNQPSVYTPHRVSFDETFTMK